MRNERDKKQPDPADNDPLTPPELPGIALSATPLSRGPNGAIYKGWDRAHHYDVIVKVLHTTGDPVAADRFRREAAVMAKLRHPNIVALYQFHDGNPSALVMEYVPGQTLEALVGADGRLEPAQAARVIEEIAAALDCIHAENVVHRDVKPSNILLPKHGPARLTDFGVAHIDTTEPLTVRGDLLGTIEYASPEQVKGTEAPDARSDVYSLAAVAYFALTGTPPFRAADSSMQSQLSVMHQQVFSEPPPLTLYRADLAPGVDAAVRRGLAKDPKARYPSAGQFASALRSAVVAASGAPEQIATAVTSRRTAGLAGVLAGAALLAGGAAVFWSHEHSAPLPRPIRHSALASHPTAPPPAVLHPAMLPPKKALKSGPQNEPKTIAATLPVPLPNPVPLRRPVPAPVRVPKTEAAERPKYRRHTVLIAQARNLAPLLGAKPRPAPAMAWLAVYARQADPLLGRAAHAAGVPARLVTVDGHPVAALASGGWAALPPGKHLIAYAPAGQSGFGPNPGLWVTLAPGAHVNRQILLPVEMSRAPRPALLAASAVPKPHSPSVPVTVPAQTPAGVSALTEVGWYTVSGWLASEASAANSSPVRTSAQWVKVDGRPVMSLALGQWAELPAGKHTITFQPTSGVNAAPKTWDIDLAPQAHLDQHIPFAVLTAVSSPPAVGWYTVSGWIASEASAANSSPVRTSAQWVKVDGRPVMSLALGQWAELPAGKHTITFQPTSGVNAASKTWDIDLAPQAHLDQHIPLPPNPAASN